MTRISTALVVVSHSAQLASGVVEVAAQMAPDVLIRPAGGTEDGRVGTSYDLVEHAVTATLADGVAGVVVLTDLGSATLTAEAVLEQLDDVRVRLADAPLVEGTVAAAVCAQGGGDADTVVAAAGTALTVGAEPTSPRESEGDGPAGTSPADERRRSLTLRNPLGLHARPAAVLARLAADHDAQVRINGVDAVSVLALMALGLTHGAELDVRAAGPQSAEVIDAITAQVEDGFGEL